MNQKSQKSNERSTKLKAKVRQAADKKEQEAIKASELSKNLDEPVEKSLAKSSADEVKSTSH